MSTKTTQREDFARDVFLADNAEAPEEQMLRNWAERDTNVEYAYVIADGLIARDYRKPRMITTVEELDALPDESVVRSDFGVIHEKRVEFDTSRVVWVCPGDTDEHTAGKITLPATVLWEPAADAAEVAARMATDSGARHSLEDVAAEFGIDLEAEATR